MVQHFDFDLIGDPVTHISYNTLVTSPSNVFADTTPVLYCLKKTENI